MSLSELSLSCPDEAKRIGQLIQSASEHFNEVLSFGDVIRKAAAGARSDNSYSSFYLNSFIQTVRSKTLQLPNLRFIKENCPDFFQLLPALLDHRSTASAFTSTDDCDPVVMNFMEITPRDMEAVKEKMAIHSYLFEWMMRSHCSGRGLEDSISKPDSKFGLDHEFSLADMLDFFEGRYSIPTARFMGRSGVGRWLQLRALNEQVQQIKGDPTPANYIGTEPDRQVAYQAMMGLNRLGSIDFERWCAATDEDVALASQYFFTDSIQYLGEADGSRSGVKILGLNIRDLFTNTAHIMLLTGNNPVQVFAEIQRRCVIFSEQFEDDPICKHVIEQLFPRMMFYPFKFMWSSLGLTEDDFRGLKAHQLLESPAEYLGRFGGLGVMHMLSYSEHDTFARAHPSAVASHEPKANPAPEELTRYTRDVEEFCTLVQEDTPQIHIKFLVREVLTALPHEVIQSELSRILNFTSNARLKMNQDEWLSQSSVANLLISRIPQAVFDTLVVVADQSRHSTRLDLLLSLRSPSQHLIQSLPEQYHASVLANDLGL